MDNVVPALTIEAPAKVNLHLGIKNRRPDGFHDLESIFLALDFGDTLHFESLAAENTLEICMDGEHSGINALPPEKNIIFRAVSLFRKKTGYNRGLRVRVEKRIPPGGGLGGGSSDAASTLLALNMLASADKGGLLGPGLLDRGLLGPHSLAEIAASLGSDVPFFLYKAGAAWVSGRGEIIKPVEVPLACKPAFFFVLVNPGFPSETAEAFRLLNEYRMEHKSNGADTICETAAEHSGQALIKALADHPRNWPFENDFAPVFIHLKKYVYQDIIAQLRELGADFAGLTGAGSTCFGVFTERVQAEKACEVLLKTRNFVIITFPLAFGVRQY